MQELFIYYRVAAADAAAALGVVQHWHAGLRERHPGLTIRLLKRPPPSAPADAAAAETWMETYASDPVHGDIDLVAKLHAELAAGLPRLKPRLAAERHVELFVPCAS